MWCCDLCRSLPSHQLTMLWESKRMPKVVVIGLEDVVEVNDAHFRNVRLVCHFSHHAVDKISIRFDFIKLGLYVLLTSL